MLTVYITIYIYPIIFNLYNSLVIYNRIKLKNYKNVMIDQQFVIAAKNWFIFVLISITLTLILGYYISVKFIGKNNKFSIFKGAFFLPILLPSSAIIFTWKKIFTEEAFVFNDLIPLVIIFLWRNVGVSIIIFLAGLMTIPDELYEAADLDGANRFQRFKFIRLPLMLTPVYIATVYLIIQSLKIGRESILLYGKFPKQSQYMISNYFNNNFQKMNIGGLTSSGTVINLLVLLIVSGLYICKRYLEEK